VKRLRIAFAVLFCGSISAATAVAHEVRPAYLEINQTDATTYAIIWKLPTVGDMAVRLVPHLSNGWLERHPAEQYAAAGFLIRKWSVSAQRAQALAGSTIEIEGLEYTITDVFVRIRLSDGRRLEIILRPDEPRYQIPAAPAADMTMPAFLVLGIEHILTGPDHLLFVLGLLLIVRNRWMLVKTVSAFTLAHSITLAASIVGKVSLPTASVEALIALSILFLAPEVLRAQKGGTSLTIRYPWVVAFAFGLFHGMGFASALTSLGLEARDLLAALTLFNVGVEIGQLAFVAVVLLVARALRSMELRWPQPVALIPAYAVGIAGAYWTIQCSAPLFRF